MSDLATFNTSSADSSKLSVFTGREGEFPENFMKVLGARL